MENKIENIAETGPDTPHRTGAPINQSRDGVEGPGRYHHNDIHQEKQVIV